MSASLPIETSTRIVTRTASVAGQTVFTTDFPAQKATDLVVMTAPAATPDLWTVLSYAAGLWSVAGLGVAAGATITLEHGADVDMRVRIIGLAVLERTSSVTANGQFRAEALDADLDRLTIIAQEARRDIDGLHVDVDDLRLDVDRIDDTLNGLADEMARIEDLADDTERYRDEASRYAADSANSAAASESSRQASATLLAQLIGALTSLAGAFSVDAMGHLIVTYAGGSIDDVAIDGNGHLLITY